MASKITVIGLGPGSPDALSMGAVRALRRLCGSGLPVVARTLRHPTIAYLESEEGIAFAASYDALYESAETFDRLYADIVADLCRRAAECVEIGYVVPGHPGFGERTVGLLRAAAHGTQGLTVEIVGAQSFVDAIVAQESLPEAPLRILDAFDIIRRPGRFEPEPDPLDPTSVHVICQVYDQAIASELKLALLDIYPDDAPVTVICAAGVPHAARRATRTLATLDHAGFEFDHLTTVVIPPLMHPELSSTYIGLVGIMARLRDPEGGCPWDREQTRASLRRYLLEEAYEVLDAMDGDDDGAYAEELGDLLLQVVFHAQMAREAGQFGMRDVLRAVTSKLVRRHPHVFGDVVARDSEQVLANWAAIKSSEKGYETRSSILDGVPRAMPALMRAQEISRRAAKAGFEWNSIDGVFDKLDEEIAELRQALADGDSRAADGELGDILFTVVNLARFRRIEAEDALGKMTERFASRFRRIEQYAMERGQPLTSLSQAQMEQVWRDAKREE